MALLISCRHRRRTSAPAVGSEQVFGRHPQRLSEGQHTGNAHLSRTSLDLTDGYAVNTDKGRKVLLPKPGPLAEFSKPRAEAQQLCLFVDGRMQRYAVLRLVPPAHDSAPSASFRGRTSGESNHSAAIVDHMRPANPLRTVDSTAAPSGGLDRANHRLAATLVTVALRTDESAAVMDGPSSLISRRSKTLRQRRPRRGGALPHGRASFVGRALGLRLRAESSRPPRRAPPPSGLEPLQAPSRVPGRKSRTRLPCDARRRSTIRLPCVPEPSPAGARATFGGRPSGSLRSAPGRRASVGVTGARA